MSWSTILRAVVAIGLAFLMSGCSSEADSDSIRYPQDVTLDQDELYGDLVLVKSPSPNVNGRSYVDDDYRMEENPGWADTDFDQDLPHSLRPERHFVSIYERQAFPTDVLIIDAMEFSDQETAERWIDDLEGWCLDGDDIEESAALLHVDRYVAWVREDNQAGMYDLDEEDMPPGWDDEREDEDLYEIQEWVWFIAYDLQDRLGAEFVCRPPR